MDRRSVLRLGVGAAATAVLAACGNRGASPPATSSPSTTSGTAPPSGAEWAALRTALDGRLVRPTDAAYPTARQLYDSRYDTATPAAIATCASATDVQRCIGFARDHELQPIPRSGGHSYGGYSTGSGLVIDVGGMAGVTAAAGTATIGAGARLIDVYGGLNAMGVSVPAGSCPTVGIAGLALGGGAGVVGRRYGMTCDAVQAVDVVTADGVLHHTTSAADPDLFWASRGGGGGNFGIATGFEMATFATADVSLFFLSWPWSAADQVLPAWLAWAPTGPDELWSNCLLATDPAQAAPTVTVGGLWSGSPGALGPLLSRLTTAAGSPSSRSTETVPFAHAMLVEAGCASLDQRSCRLTTQGGSLPRQPTLAKSDYLTAPLGDAGVAAVLAGINARRAAGAKAAVGYDSYGGAINRVAADATAFVHRSTLASAQYNVDFAPGTPADQLAADQAWLDQWYATLRPYVSGQAYQNYIDPHLADWASAYYGANLSRLSSIKANVDPDDVWRFAQSIPLPSGAAG